MATITILTQYHENYNTETTNPPYWKPKGGHKFTVEVSDTTAMYCPDLKTALTELVESQSTEIEKFEYIEHEVDFSAPTVIHPHKFETIVQKQFA